MNKVITLLLLLTLASCATTANYEKILESWVGSSADSLVSAWRAPDNVYTNNDGSKVMEFMDAQTVTTGGYSYTTPQTTANMDGSISTTYVTNTTPVSSYQSWCRTTFIVSNDGIIQSWKWRGNACKAYKPE